MLSNIPGAKRVEMPTYAATKPPAAGPSVEAMAEYEQLKDDLERAVSAWAHDQSGPDEQVELKRAGAALDLFVRPFLQPKIASVSAPLAGAVRIVDECLHDCAQWEPECPHARRARDRLTALSAEGAAGDGWRDVIAISGGLASGKGSLAGALADRMAGDHVSFGREVRRMTAEMGEDARDIDVLQRIGQAVVVSDCVGLVDRTLAQRERVDDAPLVISGLRHVEVWCELRRRFPYVRLIHIDMPEEAREARLIEREGIERRVAGRLDNALSELQLSRILPQYASVVVSGTLPVSLQVARVATCLHLDRESAPPREEGR